MGNSLHFSFLKILNLPTSIIYLLLFYSPGPLGNFVFLFYPKFTLVICRMIGLTGAYLVITRSGSILQCIYSDILAEETEIQKG